MPEVYPPIRELIPHEAPMILLDRIVGISPDSIVAEVTLAAGSLDDTGAGVAASWSLEIVAQACAAWIGHACRERGYQEGRLIKAPRWTLHQAALPTGVLLTVNADLEAASDVGVFLFNGKLCDAKSVLAEGQLAILAR